MISKLIKTLYIRHLIFNLIGDLGDLKDYENEINSGFLISNLITNLQSLPFIYSEVDSEPPIRLDFKKIELLPDSPVKKFYLKNKDLLLKIESNKNRPKEIIKEIETIQESLFNLAKIFTTNKKVKPLPNYALRGLLVIICAGTAFFSLSPLRKRYENEKKQYLYISNAEFRYQKMIEDLKTLKIALQNYYRDNKAYPKSNGGWDGVFSDFGESGEEWINGLVPKYIPELPRDPRKNENPREQYLYFSDGINFKLICHNAEAMDRLIKEHPELVDPIRPSWSIGIWSEDAENW